MSFPVKNTPPFDELFEHQDSAYIKPYSGYKYGILIRRYPEDYAQDTLADKFFNEARMWATGVRGISPMEMHLNFVKKGQYQNMNPEDYIEMIYNKTTIVNPFNSRIAIEIMRKLNIPKESIVLDPCAGWGDRAAACGKYGIQKYIGCDPNERLAPIYPKLFSAMGKSEYEFHNIPFEEYGGTECDVVLTSPPFLGRNGIMVEKYEGEKNASKFVGDEFINKFYEPMVNKVLKCLKPGGYFLLYVNEETWQASKYVGFDYLGKFGFFQDIGAGFNEHKIRDMFVLQKKK